MENEKHRILIYLNIEEYLWGFFFFSPALKHTTGNMVTEPCDRFVCMAYMSQQPAPISPSTMLCLGVHCPLITWLGERRERGGGSVGVGLRERVQWRFSWLWQAVDSWTTSSSFSSQRGWNFSHWKSRVINDWGSQNNPSVCFFCFPPFPYFSCPSSFSLAWARLRQALVW